MSILKTITLALTLASIGPGLYAQTPPPEETAPKVGLILSGGGAKGLAHIGVLKAVEEAGIKIDYIGGTSMGAIIGGLYASGYSAKELDSIFRATNFTKLIQDDIPRSAKTFYEKENSERYALTLPFTHFKLSFPQALSGGQNIYNKLVQLLYHVKDVRDFDELPIPFLCIATNVETGQEVVLDKGYLPEAIMASGTLPSLFVPSEINGVLLIDGGVVNNYPIHHIKAKGATYTIGVDVQYGLAPRDSLTSATEILGQINSYRTVEAMKKKSKATDLYIRPEIEDLSIINFNRSETIIARGETAAKKQEEALQQLAQRQNAGPLPQKKLPVQDSLSLNRLLIEGNYNYTRGYIKGKLRLKWGKKNAFHTLHQGIDNLYATGNFKTIRYRLISNESGTDLILKLRENPTKMFLKTAVHYDDLYKTSALINLTKKNLLLKDDVASLDFIIGDHIRYALQYYVDKGYYWSFGLSAKFTNFDKDIAANLFPATFTSFENTNLRKINLNVTDLTNQAYLQTVLREEFAFTLGLEHKFLRYSSSTLTQMQQESETVSSSGSSKKTLFENSHYFSTYGKMVLDTYDDPYFPSRGLFFDSDFHLYLLSSDFNRTFSEFAIAKAKFGTAFPLFRNLSLNLETEGGFKVGNSAVSTFDFVLGGYGNHFINNFIPFFGYDFLSLAGNSFAKASGKIDYHFARKHHAMLTANFAYVEDNLFQNGTWFSAPPFSGYAIGYGFESLLGPMQIHYSFTPETGDHHIFFSIGYWF